MAYYGVGTPQNYKIALSFFQKIGERDTRAVNAQYFLGKMYELGQGTTRDYSQAAVWYQKAASQGMSDAQISLGFLYERGLGVPKDEAKAADLYRHGARPLLSISPAPTPDLKPSAALVEAQKRDDESRQERKQAALRFLAAGKG